MRPAAPSASSRSTLVALLVAGAFFMENFDGTVIATALPEMARSFGSTPETLAIGMTAYLLTVAIVIPGSGWVADRLGARPVFAGAVALFTLASICCGFSQGLLSFTLARILQGGAGALMTPVGRLVVLRGTAKADLMRAIATLTWPGLVAPILGPPLGGFITHFSSWRWIFFINVPLGVVGLAAALRLLPRDDEVAPRPFDGLGFVLNGSSLALLLFALDRFGQTDGGWRVAAIVLSASLALGWLAFRHARDAPHPLISIEAFRVPSFAATMTGGMLARVVISTPPFLLPLLFQVGLGFDAFASGLLVLWYGAANLGIKPLTSSILRRFGFRVVLLCNTVIAAGAIGACALIDHTTCLWETVLVLMLAGASRSMQFTALNTLAFADLDAAMTGPANTLFNMAFQLSIGMGIGVAAIVLRVNEALLGRSADATLPFHATFLTIAAIGLLPLWSFVRLNGAAGAAVSGHAPRRAGA